MDCPADRRKMRDQGGNGRHGMALGGLSGEPVGDKNHEVAWAMERSGGMEMGARIAGQTPAKIRAGQIGGTIGHGGHETFGGKPLCAQAALKGIDIETGLHGIARPGVRQPEIELRRGPQAAAGAAEGNARRRETV